MNIDKGMLIRRALVVAAILAVAGCATVGYSYAKNPNMVKKWNGTVISAKKRNIYDGRCWSLNPLPFTCPVESVGVAVKVVLSDGQKVQIVQPKSTHYAVKPNERVYYIVDQGRVWVQPMNYPLPPDFTANK